VVQTLVDVCCFKCALQHKAEKSGLQRRIMETDSVPMLMGQLSALHLNQVLKNEAGVWSTEQKQRRQQKLKSLAFETVFQFLKNSSAAWLV